MPRSETVILNPFILLMAEILHQLRLVVYRIIFTSCFTSHVLQDLLDQQ